MDDQRISRWSAFCSKDLPACARRECVGRQTVHGLRRDSDEFTSTQSVREACQIAGRSLQDSSFWRSWHGTKKAGEMTPASGNEGKNRALLREQHVTRVLDRAGNGALVLGRKPRVLARQNLARVGDVTGHSLRLSERNLRRRRSLLLLFGRAHA